MLSKETPYEIRVWRGWRLASLAQSADGFDRFVRDLGATFVPATWQVMHRYGLLGYVPSVLAKDKDASLPDEVAILVYRSRDAYAAAKDFVAGRSYSIMHGALFEFADAKRRSGSEWAEDVAAEMPNANTRRRGPTSGGARFGDATATVHFAALKHEAETAVQAADVLAKLQDEPGEVVAWRGPGVTLVWVAAAEAIDIATRASGLLSLFANGSVAAAHAGGPTVAGGDYFADASPGISLQADRTLYITG